MASIKLIYIFCIAVLLSTTGCAVVSVASTAVNVGVSAGSAAVGVATTVAKGTVSVGSAVVGAVVD